MNGQLALRVTLVCAMVITLSVASSRLRADTAATGTCGGASITLPFTDVPGSNAFFCAIASAYFSGLTNGTTATTYSPSLNVNREQMAAFISRTHDSALRRGSRRAALNQWATPTSLPLTAITAVASGPQLVQSDGADLWVANIGSGAISRVRASDGRLVESWTGATQAFGVLVARGRIYATGLLNPGRLYSFDPRGGAGTVTTLASNLGAFPSQLTTDGTFIWTANSDTLGSVSRVNPDTGAVVTFPTAEFVSPLGILYDGTSLWVTDTGDDTLKKVNPDGSIALTVDVGDDPRFPVFDGANIWVPNRLSDSVTVVRAVGPLEGTVLATLTGNGLTAPAVAAFDGERILVTNQGSINSISLWKASNLTPLGSSPTGSILVPFGACSDGINFWVTIQGGGANLLARF